MARDPNVPLTTEDYIDIFVSGEQPFEWFTTGVLDAPVVGERDAFNQPMAGMVTMRQLFNTIRMIRSAPNLTQEQIDLFVDSAVGDPGGSSEWINAAFTQGATNTGVDTANEAEALAAANMESALTTLLGPRQPDITTPGQTGAVPTGGLGGGPITAGAVGGGVQGVPGERVGGLRGEGLGFFDTQIDRLQGFLDDPSSLRSDAEMSGILSSFEGAINAQLETTRKGAAKTLASSGLRAAGKVGDPVRAAGQQAAFQKGQGIQNLLGQSQQQLGGLRQGRLGFLGDIGAAEADIRAGGLGNVMQLGEFTQGLQMPDFGSPFLQGLDVRGLNIGQRAQDAGLFWNTVLGGIGIGQNAFSDFTGAATSALGR